MFSPHTWGCTWPYPKTNIAKYVFPTHVGVYLSVVRSWRCIARFPHTRGGVPNLNWKTIVEPLFSPHTWGCTFPVAVSGLSFQVFPTHVGVYLVST